MLSKTVVKYIQSLSHKKFREEYGVFVAEGPIVVAEILQQGSCDCKLICATESWVIENQKIASACNSESVISVSDIELSKISQLQTPNKVVGVFYKKVCDEKPVVAGKVSLLLDDIQDPGNLGTIIRIADWNGIESIICSKNSADAYNLKVVQSTMGSIARVSVYYSHLPDFLKEYEEMISYAATLDGADLSIYKPIKEGFIIIGNEARGVSPEILSLSDYKITIPRFGNAESLNAAVATGIILSHIR
ncbi:RNA methyltransferase [soil metagenome]